MPICGVIWPPHPLGGVAGRRSLFVATPPLILPRVKHGAGLLRRTTSSTRRLSVFGPQDFGCLREAASAKAGGPCICAFLSSLRKITFSATCQCALGCLSFFSIRTFACLVAFCFWPFSLFFLPPLSPIVFLRC